MPTEKDFSELTYKGVGLDLIGNAIRESVNPKKTRNKVVEAKVLMEPVLIKSDLESAGYKASSNPNPKDTDEKYEIYVRIITPFTPHRFLSEPCADDPKYSKEKRDQIFALHKNHCRVIVTGEEKPKKGDIVKITLKEGLHFDLYARTAQAYNGISRKTNESDLTTLDQQQKKACDSMESLFKSFDFTTLGNSAASYTEHFDPSIPPLADPFGGAWGDLRNFWKLRGTYNHGGTDIGVAEGTPIKAMHDGTLTVTHADCKDNHPNLGPGMVAVSPKDCGKQPDGTYKGKLGGNTAIIKHPDGYYTIYCHLKQDDIFKYNGKFVKQGDEVLIAGNTGNSTGAHLHLELRTSSGKKLNPSWYLSQGAWDAASAAREAELNSAAASPDPASINPTTEAKHG